jgi:hypothetical protein
VASQAAPQGSDEVAVALTRLIDLANDQAKEGLAHSGVLKEGVILGTANTEVPHLLGRVPRYFVAVGLSANAVVYSDTPHPDPRNFIYLKASAAVTANVLVA